MTTIAQPSRTAPLDWRKVIDQVAPTRRGSAGRLSAPTWLVRLATWLFSAGVLAAAVGWLLTWVIDLTPGAYVVPLFVMVVCYGVVGRATDRRHDAELPLHDVR